MAVQQSINKEENRKEIELLEETIETLEIEMLSLQKIKSQKEQEDSLMISAEPDTECTFDLTEVLPGEVSYKRGESTVIEENPLITPRISNPLPSSIPPLNLSKPPGGIPEELDRPPSLPSMDPAQEPSGLTEMSQSSITKASRSTQTPPLPETAPGTSADDSSLSLNKSLMGKYTSLLSEHQATIKKQQKMIKQQEQQVVVGAEKIDSLQEENDRLLKMIGETKIELAKAMNQLGGFIKKPNNQNSSKLDQSRLSKMPSGTEASEKSGSVHSESDSGMSIFKGAIKSWLKFDFDGKNKSK